MPTLIRLLVVLVVLAGIGLASMVALTVFVDPGEKEVTIKIPARDLRPASQPLDLSNLPAPVNVAPRADSGSAEPSIDTTDPEASEAGVKTVDTGAE